MGSRSYQFHTDVSPSATEAGSRPGWRLPFLTRASKGSKRTRPCCLRPCTSLRATCVTPFRLRCGKNSLRVLCTLHSNTCRQSDDDARLSFGSLGRSLKCVSQAQPKGWGERLASVVTKLYFVSAELLHERQVAARSCPRLPTLR